MKPGARRAMDVGKLLPFLPHTKFSGKIVASDAATHLVTPGTVTRHWRKRHRTRRAGAAADAGEYLQPDRAPT